MNGACDMVQKIKLAIVIFAEANDAMRCIGKFTPIDNCPLFIAKPPEFSRVVVAVDVRSLKPRQSLSIVS